MRQTIPSN